MTNRSRSLRWTACVPLAAAALAAGADGQAQAQSGVLLYAPNVISNNTSVYTANPATAPRPRATAPWSASRP